MVHSPSHGGGTGHNEHLSETMGRVISTMDKLDYLSLRGLDDFAFSTFLAVIIGAPAAVVGWQGLFAVGLFIPLIAIIFRSKTLLKAHLGRGMREGDDVVKEIVDISAEELGIETHLR